MVKKTGTHNTQMLEKYFRTLIIIFVVPSAQIWEKYLESDTGI